MSKHSKTLFELLKTLLAIVISLAVAFIVIFFVSDNAGLALRYFTLGPLISLRHFGNVIELMFPLIFTSLALCIMFRANQFNLAADGSFFAGALMAAWAAISLPLPGGLHPIVAILLGGAVGAVICLIPAILSVKLKANVLVSSLMLNYIVVFLSVFLLNHYLRDPYTATMSSYKLSKTALLPVIVKGTRIHAGIIVVILAVALSWLFLSRTRKGYEVRVVGDNAKFAGYAGLKVTSVILTSQLIGGFIAGAGGATEVLGMYKRFLWQDSPGYGWDGVIIALLARNNPLLVPVCAFLLAYVRIGADIMAIKTDVPSEIVFVIQAVLILFVASEGFLKKFRSRQIAKQMQRNADKEEVRA